MEEQVIKKYQRYSKEILSDFVATSLSFADVLRKLGKSPVGGNVTNMKLMCDRWNIDYSHMTGQGHNKGKKSSKRLTPEQRLILGNPKDHRVSAYKLRKSMFEVGFKWECNSCGINEWNGKPVTLEIDHIDECYWNNTKENLQFLCPNCHSQKTNSPTSPTG